MEDLHNQEMLLCNHVLDNWDSTYKKFLDQEWPEEGVPSVWEPQTNENIHYMISPLPSCESVITFIILRTDGPDEHVFSTDREVEVQSPLKEPGKFILKGRRD